MNLEQLQSLNLFWSYDISKKMPDNEIIIEQILKYGDTEALIDMFDTINNNKIIEIWQSTMQTDNRFERQNYYLTKFFLPKNIKTIESSRFERLKKLAAKN